MANSNGNTYPFIIISGEGQVFGVDSSQTTHSLSNSNFAMDIGISEDGTIWAISNVPDPDGGGARIYWSTGNGTWNEIATSDPGGIRISGGRGSSSYYVTSDGAVRTLDTDGTSSVLDNTYNYLEFDYGGGYVWALFAEKGGMPKLYYSSAGVLSWNAFAGDPQPNSISVGYQGNCYAVDEQGDPVYYSTDGSSSGSAGGGAQGKGLQISFKNWNYLLTNNYSPTTFGNLVYVWEDTQGGEFKATAVTAMKVLATYHTSS